MKLPIEISSKNINMDISLDAFAVYEAIVRDCAKAYEEWSSLIVKPPFIEFLFRRYGLEPR